MPLVRYIGEIGPGGIRGALRSVHYDFPSTLCRVNNVVLVKLIVQQVRQVASHLVIKNELNGFFEAYQVNEVERP
jgi:hypothetical protein